MLTERIAQPLLSEVLKRLQLYSTFFRRNRWCMPMVRNFNLLVQYAFNQFPSCVNIFYQKKMLDVEQIFEANVGPLESEVN